MAAPTKAAPAKRGPGRPTKAAAARAKAQAQAQAAGPNYLLPYNPLPWQQEFHACDARVRVVCNGRQSGKTHAAFYEQLSLAINNPGSTHYWVDPYHRFTLKNLQTFANEFRKFSPALRQALGVKIKTSLDERSITLANGSKIFFYSANNPDQLVGSTLDSVVINEAALITDPDVWEQCLLPALGAKQGRAIIVSTPRNRANWFHDVFMRGQSGCQHWDSKWENRVHTCSTHPPHTWHTFLNPTRPETSTWTKEEYDLHKSIANPLKWAQEYEANFLEEDSEVFYGFRNCIRGKLEPPNQDSSYLIGVDLGGAQDYTVVIVLDRATNHVVHFERFQIASWSVIETRVKAICERYAGRVIIDATGVGYRVAQNLYNAGLRNMEQVKISAKNKIEIIGNLMNLIAHERITYPNIPELIDELANYRVTFSAHGNEQFGPAGKGSGFHDDCCVALALCVWPLRIRTIEQPTAKQAKLIRRSLGL